MNLRKKSIVLCMLGLLCALALTFFGGTSAHAAPQLQDSLLQCEYLGYPAAVRDGDSVKCLDYEERLYAYSLSEVCNFSHKFDVEIINHKGRSYLYVLPRDCNSYSSFSASVTILSL